MDLRNTIQSLSREVFDEVRGYRRYLHQFPELSFEEKQTSAFLASLLERWQVSCRTGYAGHGIVALIQGEQAGGRCIALRADMDALPVHERTGLPYASTIPGMMHACGHDVHMASMLGTIRILKNLRSHFGGTVIFVFQPGEEKLPGGARQMIDEGALADPSPEMILGQHVLPELETGKIGIRAGRYMASSDEIYVRVKGKGGHAARPMETTDNLLAASRIIVALEELSLRWQKEDHPLILRFGRIMGDGATNVIPAEVSIEGTLRTMDEELRAALHRDILTVARAEAESLGTIAEIDIRKGYPVLVNHEGISSSVKRFATEYLGKENVVDLEPRMTSEDFAYYTQSWPACFYRLGVHDKKTEIARLHSPDFVVDEHALVTGSGCMAWLALSFLTSR